MKKQFFCIFLLPFLLASCASSDTTTDNQDSQDVVYVVSIEKTSSNGLVDTYTITYSNQKTATFTVTNGANGEQGPRGIQGEPGADGHTPVISVGYNGNWFVDGIDTNIRAQGQKGDVGATGSKGESGQDGRDGKDGTDGKDGIDGHDGKDGASLLTEHGVPNSSLGNDGDSYLNLDTWDFYQKSNGNWTLIGNIKGQDSKTYLPCSFYNYDGTKIYEAYYEKGKDIVYDGPIPTKENEVIEGYETNYQFLSWDKPLTNIQEPTIFTAQFHCPYTVTFKNYDGTVLYETEVERGDSVAYNGKTPTHPNDGNVTFDFVGWDRPFNNILKHTTVTALFDTPNGQLCTWLDDSGNTLSTSYCVTGGQAQYLGETPTKPDLYNGDVVTRYSFTGWDKRTTNIQEPTVFTAQFETSTLYVCRFYDDDKTTLLKETLVLHGGDAIAPNSPKKDQSYSGTTVTDYTFAGYDKSTSNIQEPTTFYATYKTNSYTGYLVTFAKEDGTELYRHYFKEGTDATYPYDANDLWSYDLDNVSMFVQWDKPLTNITSARAITAEMFTIPRIQNGEYPQTSVTADWKLIHNIEATNYVDSQGYYHYGDEKYCKVGEYDYGYGSYSYFKVEPIRWRILEKTANNVLVLSEKVIDAHYWNITNHGSSISINNYKESDIRNWLNNDFINTAFYYDDSLIDTTLVDNSTSSGAPSGYACDNTNDKIFLLSKNDYENTSYGFNSNESRTFSSTDYARRIDHYSQSYVATRTPSITYTSAYFVYSDGGIGANTGAGYNTLDRNVGIRPALSFKLS